MHRQHRSTDNEGAIVVHLSSYVVDLSLPPLIFCAVCLSVRNAVCSGAAADMVSRRHRITTEGQPPRVSPSITGTFWPVYSLGGLRGFNSGEVHEHSLLGKA